MNTHFKAALLVLALPATWGPAAITLSTAMIGGGGRQSSGAISIDAAIAPSELQQASPFALRTGFAGQLYDASSLSLRASPTNAPNELSYVTIDSVAEMNDGTALALQTNEVTWSPTDAKLVLIAPAMYYVPAVYTETAAAVTGAYQDVRASLALTLRNNDPDNYATAPYNFAFDGLPDDWQAAYYALGSSNAAPTADTDGDGSSAMAEYFFGTDPVDAGSAPTNAIAPTFVTVTGASFFAAAIVHRAQTPTLVFTPEIAGSLATSAWSGATAFVSASATNDSGMVTDVWRDASAATSYDARYIRVEIATPGPD